MLYNCALNPLGAILGVPYGALAEAASTKALMDRIVEEVFAVWSPPATGRTGHSRSSFSKSSTAGWSPTPQHKSSMLQDITAGKRTEIDALNGAVIRLAQEHGIAVPYNLAVYNLVRFLESRRSA